MQSPKIAFFGTPQIAANCLQTILTLNAQTLLVICQPDKQKDRKNNFVFCPVKQLSQKEDIRLLQPEKIKDVFEELQKLDLDLIITCAYGQFVPENILKLPKYGCVNIHASLLPKLRGGAPIHWAVINQEKQSGITFMYMAKQMDAGDIIFQQAIDLHVNETYQTLLQRLSDLAQVMLKQYFNQLFTHDLKTTKQINEQVTFGYNIKKEDEYLEFNQTAKQIEAKVRGLFNKPLAKIIYNGLTYKVHNAYVSGVKSITIPGTINAINHNGMFISTTDYDLVIDVIQPPSKNAIAIKALLNGHIDFKVDTVLDRKA